MGDGNDWVRWFEDLGADDIAVAGGKNASLGEMIGALAAEGVRVPAGFATTARAYRRFVEANGLAGLVREHLERLGREEETLKEAGRAIRQLFLEAEFPEPITEAIRDAYRELGERSGSESPDVAVRSSATAEDLPEASFAGQQETYLNVRGTEALLEACRKCYASLFTDRAIFYREEKGFDHLRIALSIGVQRMVRADEGGAGVLFTIDTESGFPHVVLINAAWGLGENVVKGTLNPDQYVVFKPFLDDPGLVPIIGKRLGRKERKLVYADGEEATVNLETSPEERARWVLTEEEILRLARCGRAIERHYGRPMDVEWARDGRTGEIFVVQARPETVQSRKAAGGLKTFTLRQKSEVLIEGLAIGEAIAAGAVRVLPDVVDSERFQDGEILVTEMTDPDWVPLMRRAAGIVTDHGGRTSHAAIVSRELGIPAVIGTSHATEVLECGREVTISCAEGEEGKVYEGILQFDEEELDLSEIPETRTRIMMNVASPSTALRWWRLPCRGVGLARIEYVVNGVIRIHPMALVRFDELEDRAAKAEIEELTRGYDDRREYFVEHLARAIAAIAAAQHPHPVIVRTSDFKTNEYARLVGGTAFEPREENPMLGWRGASRYYSEGYREGFALECRAIRRAREEMGFENVIVMIPFCRTPEEADRVLETMAEYGLARGERGLEIYVMAEIPSNILEADAFAERFDGFSIGSNDLTQLALGVDRDAEALAYLFDENRPTVRWMIVQLIDAAHRAGRGVGICGQAPSDRPEFAEFLVDAGIDSISVNPDRVLDVIRHVAEAEARRGRRATS